MTLRNIG